MICAPFLKAEQFDKEDSGEVFSYNITVNIQKKQR